MRDWCDHALAKWARRYAKALREAGMSERAEAVLRAPREHVRELESWMFGSFGVSRRD